MTKRSKSALGLHTPEEQQDALDMGTSAYQQAAQSLIDGDIRGYIYLYGYLSGIQGLASAEGKPKLVSDLQVLRERLVEMEKHNT